jgi:hypothetical protein
MHGVNIVKFIISRSAFQGVLILLSQFFIVIPVSMPLVRKSCIDEFQSLIMINHILYLNKYCAT